MVILNKYYFVLIHICDVQYYFPGFTLSPLVTLPLVGYLCSTWMGWPSTFYLFGSLNLIWVGLYFVYGSDSPKKHPKITYEERQYIESSLKRTDVQVSKNIKKVFNNIISYYYRSPQFR